MSQHTTWIALTRSEPHVVVAEAAVGEKYGEFVRHRLPKSKDIEQTYIITVRSRAEKDYAEAMDAWDDLPPLGVDSLELE